MVVALKIAHIAFAAAWFGHKLLIPGDVHESIRDVEGYPRFMARISRAQRLGLISGLLTLASGAWLIYEVYGLDAVPTRIWVGLGITVAIFLVGAFLARPAWGRIKAGLLIGEPAAASAGVVSFRRALLLDNLLWLLALGTMVAN